MSSEMLDNPSTAVDFSCFRSSGVVNAFGLQPQTEAPQTGPLSRSQPCINCKMMLEAGMVTCPQCGVNRQFQIPAGGAPPLSGKSTKSRTLAAALAIFFGAFGVHKFYLGKTGWGLLYLVFFWAYIPGILGIVEGIYYLTLNDAQFAQKYG